MPLICTSPTGLELRGRRGHLDLVILEKLQKDVPQHAHPIVGHDRGLLEKVEEVGGHVDGVDHIHLVSVAKLGASANTLRPPPPLTPPPAWESVKVGLVVLPLLNGDGDQQVAFPMLDFTLSRISCVKNRHFDAWSPSLVA
jgi:hypothetical protein